MDRRWTENSAQDAEPPSPIPRHSSSTSRHSKAIRHNLITRSSPITRHNRAIRSRAIRHSSLNNRINNRAIRSSRSRVTSRNPAMSNSKATSSRGISNLPDINNKAGTLRLPPHLYNHRV